MKVLIIDDHWILLEGVKALLHQAFKDVMILEADTYADGFAIATATADLELVLLDLAMPDRDGMAAIAELGRLRPGLPVVVLSASDDPEMVRRAIAMGALGYIPKTAEPQTLVSAVRFVLDGNIYVPPIALEVKQDLSDEDKSGGRGKSSLTGRQIEILKLIGEGLSSKEIGRRLGLSEKTVKTHITAIFRALDVANRIQALNAARRKNLL